MKNVLKMMLIGAAFAAPSTAFAAECNLGFTNITITPKALSLSAPTSTATEIAATIYNLEALSGVKASCSQEQLAAAIARINGAAPIALEQSFKVPVLIAPAPAPAAEAPAPAPVEVPPVVPTVRVKTPASPELTRLRAQQQANAAELKALRGAIRARGVNAPQAPGETAKIAALSAKDKSIEAQIKALEASLKLKADKSYVDAQNKQQDIAIAEAAGKATTAERIALEAKAAAEAADGMSFWMQVLLYAAGVLALAAFGLGIFNLRRKPGVTKDELNTKLAEAKLNVVSVTALADIETLKAKVEGLTSRFKHEVTKIKNGEQATLLPAIIKQMEEGKIFDYHVMVDGVVITFDARVVQRTPSGDALIKIEQLGKPVTAKSLFTAVADYVEAGGELPILKLVQTA